MSDQAWLFLWTVVIGLGCGLFYDIIRIFRRLTRHGALLAVLEDLMYWIFVATVVFYIFLNRNYGEIRGFCLLGLGIGMALYFSLLSRYVLKTVMTATGYIQKALTAVRKAVEYPCRLFIGFLIKTLAKPKAFIKKKLLDFTVYIKKVLQKLLYCVKLKIRSVIEKLVILHKKVFTHAKRV